MRHQLPLNTSILGPPQDLRGLHQWMRHDPHNVWILTESIPGLLGLAGETAAVAGHTGPWSDARGLWSGFGWD